MKFTLNVILTIAFLSSIGFAGDQGNGNNQGCTINCPPPPCTENCDGSQAGTNEPAAIGTDLLIVAVGQYFGLSL